jgi:hypothetical protein
MWESVRPGDGNVPAAAADVNDSAIELVPWVQITERARLTID